MHVDDEPTPGIGPDGRPDPAYARALGLVPAPAGRRAAAFALDATAWVVLAVPAVIGSVMLAGLVVGQTQLPDAAALTLPLVLLGVGELLLLVFGVVQLVLHGRRGVTLGKASLGIRSVRATTFGPAGFWRVVLRVLVLWGAWVVLPIAGPAVLFASSAWDPEARGRSWLDRIGRCWAVDIRTGLDPFDAKALRHARRQVEAGSREPEASLPSLASDRPVGDELFIPSARSSSGVVSASPSEAGDWAPPPLVPASGAAPAPVAASAQAAASAVGDPRAAPAPRSELVLVFDDGTRLPVSEPGLLGRSPAVAPGESPVRLVPLVDESMRISKTHAAYGVDDGSLWVADRSSKNGTFMELPDGSSRQLTPGIRTPVPAGATVALGGRRFTVTVASGGTA